MTSSIRLQRAIAEAGVASRRAAESLIAAGRVRVDGRTAELGERVDPTVQRIEVNGRPLPGPATPIYLVLSKPAGVTSTVRDRHACRTVLDLVPPVLARGSRLYPVGRLDRESEGLLLLMNDGQLAERLLHPRYGVEREYAVGLPAPLAPTQEAALRAGMRFEEGRADVRDVRRARPTEIRELTELIAPPPRPGLRWYRVVLTQGRRRQLRRMFAAVGAPVERLVRVRVGPLRLLDLAPGEVRPLRAKELARLRSAAGVGAEPRGPEDAGSGGPEPGQAQVHREQSRGPDGASAAATEPAASAHRLVVALDGPASSGKSTVGAAAAAYLGYRFCDTGMLYRAVTWLALERGIATGDAKGLAALVGEVDLVADAEGRLSGVVVAGREVTDRVTSSRVDRHVSEVSQQPAVRKALLPHQRALTAGGGIVMAGRDIGTVVLPGADLKLFLDASAEERARRRAEQRGLEPDSPAAARILAELRRRDRLDSSRMAAPLRIAPGAVVIATDGNTVGQTIDAVVAAIRKRERELRAAGRRRRQGR